jgi:hypothetical protein
MLFSSILQIFNSYFANTTKKLWTNNYIIFLPLCLTPSFFNHSIHKLSLNLLLWTTILDWIAFYFKLRSIIVLFDCGWAIWEDRDFTAEICMSLWSLRFIEEFPKFSFKVLIIYWIQSLRVCRYFVLVMLEKIILNNTREFRVKRLSNQRLVCGEVMMSRWDSRLFFILLCHCSSLRSTCEWRLETYASTSNKNRLLNYWHMIKISVGLRLIIRCFASCSSFRCWIGTFIDTKAALLGFLLIFPWPLNE